MARSQNSVRITVSLPDGDHADLLDTAEQHDVSLPWLARRAVEKHLTRSLALSKDVNDSTSIAAIGVATHEAGHAIQHAAHYAPLWLRSTLVPTANIGSSIGYVVMMIGLFMASQSLVGIGALLFSAVLLFQIVTLPVEFDVTARAKKLVVAYGIISERERGGDGPRVEHRRAHLRGRRGQHAPDPALLFDAGRLPGRAGRLAVRARFRSLRQPPVEHGDSLPEHRRWTALPRLPLVDDGFPRGTHERGQLRLAHPVRTTQRANLHIVVVRHAGPTRRLSPVCSPHLPSKVGMAELASRRQCRAAPEPSKGRLVVIGHRQPPVSGRRPQRLDVHADQQREHG